MYGGWLAKVIEDKTLIFFGFIQFLGSKRVVFKEKNITLVKASDGIFVTWHVVVDESQEEKMLSLPKNSGIIM